MRLFRANILPLALVITATILIAGLSLGMIVLESLQRTAETDASMVAYYAADAGIEEQLYEVRKLKTPIEDLSVLGETFGNGSAWEAATSGFIQTTAKAFPELQEGDFQFVDLFDPDKIGAMSGISKVEWSWVGDGSPGCEVELGYAEWDFSGGEIIPSEFKIVRGISSPNIQTLDPSKAYRLRFRPRRCDVENLVVKVYEPSDPDPVPFPGDMTLGSEGTYENTTQAISVTMPRQDVLSGVFSYVIFTECTLFKDPTGTMPPCP